MFTNLANYGAPPCRLVKYYGLYPAYVSLERPGVLRRSHRSFYSFGRSRMGIPKTPTRGFRRTLLKPNGRVYVGGATHIYIYTYIWCICIYIYDIYIYIHIYGIYNYTYPSRLSIDPTKYSLTHEFSMGPSLFCGYCQCLGMMLRLNW